MSGTTSRMARRVLSLGSASIAAARRAPNGSTWLAASPRLLSTAASAGGEVTAAPQGEEKAVASYWGVAPAKLLKEDGTEWKWNCFKVCYYFYRRLKS